MGSGWQITPLLCDSSSAADFTDGAPGSAVTHGSFRATSVRQVMRKSMTKVLDELLAELAVGETVILLHPL